MGLSLQQTQTQKLTLTSELVQSIKILQCNSVELNDLIGEELLSNPMLELSENQPDPNPIEEYDNRFDWTEHAKERAYDDLASRHIITESESEDYNYEQFVKAKWSLSDFLHMQLSLIKLEPEMFNLADYIIDTLNELGYRTERATEIANKFGISHNKVIEAIKIVQSLEPAGIGAKSIPECLQIQLERMGKYDVIFQRIIYEHLDDLAANRMLIIAKAVNLTLDKTVEYCNAIKALDPKPGVRYSKGEENKYIIPDIFLKELDDRYIVLQNEHITPLLNASPYYDKLLKEAAGDKETINYLHKKMDSALWLIKGIDQRRQTIQKIAEAIVEKQKDFFAFGVKALTPMNLSDIAELTGVHISTVSRAVNGKYMQTPKGLFELKYFFNTGISSVTGFEQSSATVKKQIQDIIANENPNKPFSDDKIKSLLLSNYGIDIARRTVAKYREQLGILGTSKRKKY